MSAGARDDAAAVEWIRSRPVEVQALMRRFPPLCKVRAVVVLRIPAPGTVGQVVSYFEADERHSLGLLGVMQDGGGTRAQCGPEQLEVIGYSEGWTPERVASAIGGAP